MEKETLEKFISQGFTQREIAKATNKSQTTIRYWLVKLGLETIKVYSCSKCGESDKTKFTPGRFTQCRKCRGKYQTKKFRSYKQKAVDYKGGKCELCGYNRCLGGLDFHHRNPSEKDPKWRLMKNWKFSRIIKELDKCDLVCKNCHSEIHYGIDNS